MASTLAPRVVLVTRSTELDGLLARHATREQARFFLETRGQSIFEVEERHRRFEEELQRVLAAVPTEWRRNRVDRADLSRFLFQPEDLVIVLGQDGLVANAAKYLDGQAVIGLNPEPERNEGVLVSHSPDAAAELMRETVSRSVRIEERTMVEARLDDGRSLVALNELFVGHRTHQSARYRLSWGGSEELQSSSGLIVTTGTGATGWARSIVRERARRVELPGPTEDRLAFFVREAWPSVATGVELTQGLLGPGDELAVVSEMEEGVLFGDGIEEDRVEFGWGRPARLGISRRRLRLVVG